MLMPNQQLDNCYQLVNLLGYGKMSALTAEALHRKVASSLSLPIFKRKLRTLAHEARLNGHRVIGDDNGYYKAITQKEWNEYRTRRFSSFSEELKAFASCEKISVADLIKDVYHIDPTNPNYSLDL